LERIGISLRKRFMKRALVFSLICGTGMLFLGGCGEETKTTETKKVTTPGGSTTTTDTHKTETTGKNPPAKD
jgi:hypothetical protein